MAISKRTRFSIFKRDLFKCQYCGRTPPTVVLEADHVIPVSGGGTDAEHNLVTSCFDCNRGKSNVPLAEAPQALRDAMKEKRIRREQVEAFNEWLLGERDNEDGLIERLGRRWFELQGSTGVVFGIDRTQSSRTFLRRMTLAQMLDAIEIAYSRMPPRRGDDSKTWKYFCGVCWGMIRKAEAN